MAFRINSNLSPYNFLHVSQRLFVASLASRFRYAEEEQNLNERGLNASSFKAIQGQRVQIKLEAFEERNVKQ